MPMLSIVTPCFNEVDNLELLCRRIREVAEKLPGYSYEHIIVNNASTDGSQALLRRLAAEDPRIKVIFNVRNFGATRSGYYSLLQATGDAVIGMSADLQDPPELIPQFVAKWEAGYKIAIGIKSQSEESALFFAVRRLYYFLVGWLSNVPLVKNTTGFGLYDRCVIDLLREIDDPYPYFRGMICDLGFERAEIPYVQAQRKRGFSKSNFYSLYDVAMLGITNHSKVPLRLATLTGFCLAR